jgi:hypothetical protein
MVVLKESLIVYCPVLSKKKDKNKIEVFLPPFPLVVYYFF